MQRNNSLNNSESEQNKPELSPEDLAKLFNYPAIGELFEENDAGRVEEFGSKMKSIHGDLERIARSGSRDEAESAFRAIRGIEVTLEFLETIQKMRVEEKN